MYYFILGAPDPEMREIEALCLQHNWPFGYASKKGKRVNSSQAYRASGVIGNMPKHCEPVFVECDVKDIVPHCRLDHHNPGDPGFEMPAERYWEGSSLGQFCTLMGISPSDEQKVIAAADHCLTHAYAGKCPGVDVDDLAYWRLSTRARVQGRSMSELQKRVHAAMLLLQQAPRVRIGSEEVADMGLLEGVSEIGEASARLNIPYVYAEIDREGRLKKGIKGASATAISIWLGMCEFSNTYGSPARGYAGAYGPMVKPIALRSQQA